MEKRPVEHKARFPPGLDLNASVEKACHRHCVTVWSAYERCREKQGGVHDKCSGWWQTYANCVDTCTPRLTLSVLETMAAEDPDPNMERLRR